MAEADLTMQRTIEKHDRDLFAPNESLLFKSDESYSRRHIIKTDKFRFLKISADRERVREHQTRHDRNQQQ